MIQRVQTIFMFIATISMFALLFLPIWEKSEISEQETREYVVMNVFELSYEKRNAQNEVIETIATQNVLYLSIGAMLTVAVMLFSIFQYKNRRNQVKLNALFSLLCCAIVVGIYFNITKANQLIQPQMSGSLLAGFYLPLVALINNFAANRFIRKDERLVRSADRIR